MRHLCRIFISDSKSLRSFYWFECASDESIYFGSSNAKRFRYGYTGELRTSATEGTRVDPKNHGRAMTLDELGQKNSIHGSGIVNQGILENGQRQRYQISPPREGFKFLPVVGVLPMHPSKYQISYKTPRSTDIVIDLGPTLSPPFGAMFYLNRSEDLEPPPVIQAKSMYERFITRAVALGNSRLCVSIYADSSHMRHWPSEEGSILGLPEVSGGKPPWPFFANTSGTAP